MAPSTGKALVTRVTDSKEILQFEDIPMPKIKPYQLLVRVSSVVQNPTDAQYLNSNAFGDGAVLGCDSVGIVEKLEDVKNLKIGDRVAGLIWGDTSGPGAYSQYTVADEKICFKVPKTIDWNDASYCSVGCSNSLACTLL